jgi:hypothetical protein
MNEERREEDWEDFGGAGGPLSDASSTGSDEEEEGKNEAGTGGDAVEQHNGLLSLEVNQMFESFQEAEEHLHAYAKDRGFAWVGGMGGLRNEKQRFAVLKCCRGGAPQARRNRDVPVPIDKQRNRASMKCGCRVRIRLRHVDPCGVCVASAQLEHTSGCNPGKALLAKLATARGTSVPLSVIQALAVVVGTAPKGGIATQVVRYLNTVNTGLSKAPQAVRNIVMRVRVAIENDEVSMLSCSAQELEDGLTQDEISKMLKGIWKRLNANADGYNKLVAACDIIKGRMPDFDYRVQSEESDTSKRIVVGLLWMFGTGRERLCRFGDFLLWDPIASQTVAWRYV